MQQAQMTNLVSMLRRMDRNLEKIASELAFHNVLQASVVAQQNGIPVADRILKHLQDRVGQ